MVYGTERRWGAVQRYERKRQDVETSWEQRAGRRGNDFKVPALKAWEKREVISKRAKVKRSERGIESWGEETVCVTFKARQAWDTQEDGVRHVVGKAKLKPQRRKDHNAG